MTPGPLRIGPLAVTPPVVLAPMAGITNAPFRRLCRGFTDGGLFVSEMITARAPIVSTRPDASSMATRPQTRPSSTRSVVTNHSS